MSILQQEIWPIYNIFVTRQIDKRQIDRMQTKQEQYREQIELIHRLTQINGSLLKTFQYEICEKDMSYNMQCLINNVEKESQQSSAGSILEANMMFQGINQQIMAPEQQQKAANMKDEYRNIDNTNRAILFLRAIKRQETLYDERRQKIKQQYGDLNKLLQVHKMTRESLLKQSLKTYNGPFNSQRIDINLKNEQKISLIGEDIQKLKENSDLNDAIIEAYIKIMKFYILDKEMLPKVFIYSTYFLQKLLGDGINEDLSQSVNSSLQMKRLVDEKVKNSYNNVKRWTKNEDIFSKDILVFPINYANHWNCILVLKPCSLLDNQNECQIIYCDSMFEHKEILVQFIRSYLRFEIEHKKGKYVDVTRQIVPSYQLLLPRQPNHHDCGIYMLLYIEQLLLNHKKELSNLRSTKNRHKLHLFPIKLIMTMRYRLVCLFLHLSKSLSSSQSDNLIRNFLIQKNEILMGQPLQFETIDEQQYKKYLILNNFKRVYLLKYHNLQEESEFILKIRFYLDPQINYFTKTSFE